MGIRLEDDFLQVNADYFQVSIYDIDFNDENYALNVINNWVSEKTENKIDHILDRIDKRIATYIINAVIFDARWRFAYVSYDTYFDNFTDVNGKSVRTEFMKSQENRYIDNGEAIGFIKPYFNNLYSFVALMPNADIPINDYIQSLTGMKFIHAVKTAADKLVFAYLPKYKYEFKIEMNDVLIDMGMIDAFGDKSDFSKIVMPADGRYRVNIGRVLHKAFIEVNELGTKAGAASVVAVTAAAWIPPDLIVVKLDRPFVYAIIDNATNLPIFIGAVMTTK